MRPYFEAERVLRDGIFFAAERLYGLTFHDRADLPGYHPDVRVFEVREDGAPIGLYLLDLYTRDTKKGGAWMNESRPPVDPARRAERRRDEQPQRAQAGQGRADAAHLRRGQHVLPRVRPCPARPARARHLPALRRYPRLPRLRRVPEPGQRDVDALAGGPRATTPSTTRRASRCRRISWTASSPRGHSARGSRRASTSRPHCSTRPGTHSTSTGGVSDGRRCLRGEPRWKRLGLRIPWCRLAIRRPTSRTPSPTPTTRSTTPTSGARCSTPTRWRGSRENGGLTRENGDRYRRYVIGIGGAADPLASYREFRGRDADTASPPRAPRPPLRPGEPGRMPLGSLPAQRSVPSSLQFASITASSARLAGSRP